MPVQPAARRHRGGVAAVALVLGLLAGCRGEAPEPEAPVPALSREGSRWDVSRRERRVFWMANAGGKLEWSDGSSEHPFLSGAILEPGEERRIKPLVRQSRHFRDFVQRLQRAGYRVSPQ